MKTSLSVFAAAAALVAFSACNQKQTAPAGLPTPPAIKSFLAENPRLVPGESTRLTFVTENATEIELVDQTGQKLPYSGPAASGEVTVSPTVSSFYVLRARGEGGIDTAFVQVAVGEPLKGVFLVAVPEKIEPGESSQLIWSAFNGHQVKIQNTDGEHLNLDPEAGSGIIDVSPSRSVTYQLVATPLDPKGAQTATATVQVMPKLDRFEITPPAGVPGDVLTFTWNTRGGEEVLVTEATLGEIGRFGGVSNAALVDNGSIEWTIPATTAGGSEMSIGRPLHFTLTVRQTLPAVTLQKTIDTYVGPAPKIVDFNVAPAVTSGKTFDIAWTTQNGTRLQLFANGGLIYEPLALEPGKIANGSVKLQAPLVDTQYDLVLTGINGITVQQSRLVKSVKPPVIDSFTIGSPVDKPGDSAQVSWKVQDASMLFLRVKDGPNTFYTHDPKLLNQGTTLLYPGGSGTFVLEAYNLAGDVATAEADVVVAHPEGWTVTPSPLVVGEPVTVSWKVNFLTTAQFVGDPTQPPVKNNPSLNWYELDGHVEARNLLFSNADDAVTAFTPAIPFRFPYVGSTNENFWVSTNGFVTFARPKDALPNNEDLRSTSAAVPQMLAPFWDDLELGSDSQVLWHVEGTSFPRRMIIQWNRLHTADPGSELTFQVQLFESGEFHFLYKTMVGVGSGGEDASIGWRVNETLAWETAVKGGASVASGDELLWFTSGSLEGTYQVQPKQPGLFTAFARLANNRHIVYPQYVNAVEPGQIVVNELMPLADPSAVKGQWIELYNPSSRPVDLGGLKLNATNTMTSFEFPPRTIIAPGDYLVVGQSTDTMENGGAPVDLAWTDLNPDTAADETLTITAGMTEVSNFQYVSANITPAQSVQSPDEAIDATGAPLTCARTKTYGPTGAIGTPGERNETCFDYVLDRIPVDFVDISTTGTDLFDQSLSYMPYPYVKTNFDISKINFKYFGSPQNSVSVISNGYLAFSNVTYGTGFAKLTPSTSSPASTVAIFWDYLDKRDGGDGTVFAKFFEAGKDPGVTRSHYVFHWHDMTYSTYPPTDEDDLNFQVKLFEDGVIEFHYGEMLNGPNGTTRASGDIATIWIERPTGDAALPIGINEPVLTPNSAYRFTPKQ